MRVYRAGAHDGEEPPVSGTRGSGTVFFSHCPMRCLYCQNHPWSQEGQGRDLAAGELVEYLQRLRDVGCHNWNLVTATPWLPQVREALAALRRRGVRLPVVYNTSGYERVETLADYADDIDVYLADLRYATAEQARAGSAAPDYPAVARAALQEMWRQKGPLETDADGIAVRGVIVRVLVLPGAVDEAIASLDWLARMFGRDLTVSLMSQYIPAFRAVGSPPWNRRLEPGEYTRVCAALEACGLDRGWVQELEEDTAGHLVGYQMEPGNR